jgi:hypothetical protein
MAHYVLWLNGLAGTGKSTIVWTAAKAMNERKELAAHFFFSRHDHERRQSSSVLPTIAYQLALWRGELRGPICAAVERSLGIAKLNIDTQIQILISGALQNAEPVFHGRGLMVLDELDECEDDSTSILPFLINAVSKLSWRLKILVTSRPEHPITSMFDGSVLSVPTTVLVLHTIRPQIVSADIALYMKETLREIFRRANGGEDWPPQEDLNALVRLASPLFIFAATVVRFIDSSAFPLSASSRQSFA